MTKQVRFGMVCNEIYELVKSENDNAITKKEKYLWTQKYAIVNGLHCLVTNNTALESEFSTDKGQKYQSDVVTNFFKGEKAILAKLRKLLNTGSANRHIARIEEEISNLSQEFPKVESAKNIYQLFKATDFNSVTFVSQKQKNVSINWSDLAMYFDSSNWDKLLAACIFYVFAFISNKIDESEKNIDKNSAIYLSESMSKCLEKGHFYDYFHRTIYIEPSIAEGCFVVTTITEYKSSVLNPNRLSNDVFYSKICYSDLSEANSVQLIEFSVNEETKYLSNIRKTIKSDLKKHLPHEVEFTSKKIYEKPPFHVLRTIEQKMDFPVYEVKHSLPMPCKNFHLEIQVIGSDSYKWSSFFSFFTPFRNDLAKNKDFFKTRTNNVITVHSSEWLPSKIGYSLSVRPKKEYWTYWQNSDT